MTLPQLLIFQEEGSIVFKEQFAEQLSVVARGMLATQSEKNWKAFMKEIEMLMGIERKVWSPPKD